MKIAADGIAALLWMCVCVCVDSICMQVDFRDVERARSLRLYVLS